MKREGFSPVRNPQGYKGMWFYDKRRRVLYGKTELSEVGRQQAAWRHMQAHAKAMAEPSR